MAKARAKGRRIAPLELSANQVERWFAELTRKRLRRGVHTSVRHLQADIRALHRPAQPKPQALQMDQVRRSNIGFGEALLPEDTEDIMQRTLDSRD